MSCVEGCFNHLMELQPNKDIYNTASVSDDDKTHDGFGEPLSSSLNSQEFFLQPTVLSAPSLNTCSSVPS